MEVATFAGGCFWRMQTVFSRVPGVISTIVGFAGGYVANPTYQQVRSGQTGHAETVQVTYNPQLVTFPQLLQIFFSSHDSTQMNRQGADVGPQYRSAIFYHSPSQWDIATKYINQLRMSRPYPVVTEVVPFQAFYPAEQYHQFYEARQQQQNMVAAAAKSYYFWY
ncbi:unnamed protein product [Adineta steineri]|uniref:peptide-methionine (S)-S-oxide reductase n=1 Tax=Adineta steineri TaxID=433720 RepID=A0A815KPY1_9BILA|nr:unnamed protein product [Adineta steineri]CAF3693315.1 unnamed protein product [Adineta steineri]